MTKVEEIELFDYLSRTPKFRDWLNSKLQADISVLMQAVDVDLLRKSQGKTMVYRSMLDLLDQAPAASKKPL